MNTMVEYGFICEGKDEKVLIKALNDFLEPLKRTLSKTNNKSMLNARLPYVYNHFYWNLNKDMQVYIELYPNKDLEGKYKFPNNLEVGWVLFANLNDEVPPYHVPLQEQQKYLNEILSSVKFDYIKLCEYDSNEERL